jgi:N-acetylglucosaminyl-diphospho-decaprenol L-rhamnosyltransferase
MRPSVDPHAGGGRPSTPEQTSAPEAPLEPLGERGRPGLDVVIVNWNAGPHLRSCLQALVESRRSAFDLERVVVVDNGSSDESLEGAAEVSLPLDVVRNGENRGFAAACNQGASRGSGDLVLFLNPDTRVFPDALDLTVAFMSDPANDSIGICGGQMVDDDGLSDFSCARFPTLAMLVAKMLGLDRLALRVVPRQRLSADETSTSGRVDQVIGAYFMIRRPLFERLGGFDERFFVYLEEVDLAYRAQQLGADTYFLREALVYHAEHASSDQVLGKRLFYGLRSRTEYARKHWPAWQAVVLVVLTFAIEIPVRAAQALLGRRRAQLAALAEATRLYARYTTGRA